MQKRELRRATESQYVSADKALGEQCTRVDAARCRVQQTMRRVRPNTLTCLVAELSVFRVEKGNGIDMKISNTLSSSAKKGKQVRKCSSKLQTREGSRQIV